MRYRTNSNELERPVTYNHPNVPPMHSYFSWTSFTHHEEMLDISRPQDHLAVPDRTVWVTPWVNPVMHQKWQYNGRLYSGFSGDYGLYIQPVYVFPCLNREALLSMLPTLSETDKNDLLLEAFNAFTEVWPEELSVAESAQGLLDIKSMIPKFSGDIVQDLASLHLNKSFAWDSLFSDLKAFRDLNSNVLKNLQRLRDTWGKATPLSFRRKNVIQASLGSELTVEPERAWGTRYVLRNYRCDFTARATLHQRLEHLDDSIGYIRGLVGALGGANPLKQIWNLVPLSFVVDYFFNISERLDALARLRPVEPWELSRVTHSFKETAMWDIWQTNPNIWEGPQSPDQLLGTLVMTRYTRRLGLPYDVLNFWDVSTLNPAQLGLLSALIAGIKHR